MGKEKSVQQAVLRKITLYQKLKLKSFLKKSNILNYIQCKSFQVKIIKRQMEMFVINIPEC